MRGVDCLGTATFWQATTKLKDNINNNGASACHAEHAQNNDNHDHSVAWAKHSTQVLVPWFLQATKKRPALEQHRKK